MFLSEIVFCSHCFDTHHFTLIIFRFFIVTIFFQHFLFFDRDVQGNLGGGQFVSTVVNNMHKMVTNSSDKYRFIHFSGHDSTIQAILSALRLSTDHPELQQLPPYGRYVLTKFDSEL